MLETKEIFGRSESKTKKLGTKGCSYIGKNVSYPGGEYEEMGKAYLDIVSPHCMLIVGKRGTGKSYTLGVIAEGFARLKEKYSNNLSLVLIDTMSVFHSLKKENTNESEIELMDNFDIEPKSWKEDVKILVPEAAIKKARQNGEELHFDEILKIALSRVEVHEWLELFDLEITSSTGTLLSRVITELKKKGNFSFEDIYRRISDEGEVEESTKNSLKTLFEMIQKLDIFSKAGMDETMVEGGKITVLDISHLGRLGDYELRSLIVSIFAREQMAKRTLYTTVEMQAQAGLGEKEGVESITEEYPIVYMLIDEAHLFLPSEGTTLATKPLIDWIKLGRHPGLSLIMATQEPSALHASAIKQSDMIIAHNMTAKGDLDALKLAKQSYM
ncbi:MAG: ATP-binding protein, partial [Candidatus Thermoplasmatota archaeon]|nr:ATP-binding protein [Candidatus Thermoplasmatota archaeon]